VRVGLIEQLRQTRQRVFTVHGGLTCRRSVRGAPRSTASLTAVIVMPQTLARLERLAAALTRVRPCVRVDAFMRSHRRRVLEPLPTTSTSLVQLTSVLKQRVLLEMVPFFEANRADVADKRTIIRVRSDVVLVVGRVSKNLSAHFTRPLVLGSGTGGQRQRLHGRQTGPR